MIVIEGWIAGNKYDCIPKPEDLNEDVLNILTDSIAINSKASISVDTDTGVAVSFYSIPIIIFFPKRNILETKPNVHYYKC